MPDAGCRMPVSRVALADDTRDLPADPDVHDRFFDGR